MAKLEMELPVIMTPKSIKSWMEGHSFKHIKNNHNFYTINVGDGIKCHDGTVARVVEKRFGEAGQTIIIIANNAFTAQEMAQKFYGSAEMEKQSYQNGCPHCGSKRGNRYDCPDCGNDQY
jgi:hypothetical protein